MWSYRISGWLVGRCEDLETKQETGGAVRNWRNSDNLETQCEIGDSAKSETV
jgi:hypothetical protein